MGIFEKIRSSRAKTKAEIKAAEAKVKAEAKHKAKLDLKREKLIAQQLPSCPKFQVGVKVGFKGYIGSSDFGVSATSSHLREEVEHATLMSWQSTGPVYELTHYRCAR